jgi:hypothetical protein
MSMHSANIAQHAAPLSLLPYPPTTKSCVPIAVQLWELRAVVIEAIEVHSLVLLSYISTEVNALQQSNIANCQPSAATGNMH